MTSEEPPAVSTSRRSTRMGLTAFAIMLITATLALPIWAFGATGRASQDVTIASGETIADDIYVLSDTFTLRGRASGDVGVVAREIDIDGTIGGSLNAAGGDITISGTVGRSVRVVSGRVEISGSVGADLLVLGGIVEIDPSAHIAGDIQVHGGTLDSAGAVNGGIAGSISSLSLNGPVGGDVSVNADRVDVGSRADITGALSHVGPRDASISAGAVIAGPIDRDTIAPWGIGSDIRARFFSPLVRTVWLLVAGAIVIALAPRFAYSLNESLRRPGIAMVVGLLALVAIPVIAVVLMISIVGIPASLIVLAAYTMALYLSQYIVGQRLGSAILPDRWNDGSRGYLLLSMTIGVILLGALRFVPVPHLSSVIGAVVAILGLGAAVMLLGQLRPGRIARAR